MRARRVPRPRGGRIFVGMTAMVFAGKTRPVYRRASPAAGKTRPVYRSASPAAGKPARCTNRRNSLPRNAALCTVVLAPLPRNTALKSVRCTVVPVRLPRKTVDCTLNAEYGSPLYHTRRLGRPFSLPRMVQTTAFLDVKLKKWYSSELFCGDFGARAQTKRRSRAKLWFQEHVCDALRPRYLHHRDPAPPFAMPEGRGLLLGVFCRALCRESSPGFLGSFAPSLSRGLCLHAQRRARQREKRRSCRR